MRAYLVVAPVWVRSLVLGVIFGTTMTVVGVATSPGWVDHVITGVIGGVVFGVVMGRFAERDFGASRAELRDLSVARRRVALRAAARGPAPNDPAVRRAALTTAENSRDLINRRWRFSTTVFAIALVVYLVAALTWSPWWWLGFAAFTFFTVLHLTSRRRVERRIATLSEASPAGAS